MRFFKLEPFTSSGRPGGLSIYEKMEASNEKIEASNEKMEASNEKMEASNEKMRPPMKK